MTDGAPVVRVDRPADGVLRLRLDRPQRRNALNGAVVDELLANFSRPEAAVVILGSTDPRAFCAGADTAIADDERAVLSDRLYELYECMLGVPVPIIAAVRGHAVGGGAQLMLASDVRIAAPDARIRFAGAGHGLAVGAWALPASVGRGRAIELCLSMRTVEAAEAERMGLVERVVEDPDDEALALARHIVGLDGAAVARLKRIVAQPGGLAAGLVQERRENRMAWSGSLQTRAGGGA